MKALKIAALAAGGLVALLVVLVIAVAILFDPNDYRDDIEQLALRETGRTLDLEGDLDLSVFPWLAIEFGPATLSDAPGFGDEPFVAIGHARLSLRLLPLLRGSVEVGDVRLDGVNVRLITDEQGRSNWADLVERESGPEPGPGPAADELSMPTIAGLDIRDGGILLEDRREASRIELREFNLLTGRLESGRPFDVESSFVLGLSSGLSVRTQAAARVTADFAGNVHAAEDLVLDLLVTGEGYPQEGMPVTVRVADLTADLPQERHVLSTLEVATTLRGEGMPSDGIPVSVQVAEVRADLAAQTLGLAGLVADFAGASVTGTLDGSEILDAPRIAGRIELSPVSLREWLPRLGVELPVTSDPAVLGPMNLTAAVAATASSAELSDLVLRFDDTTATGTLGVADFESQALRFDLDIDRIDADRYLPPEEEAPADEAAAEPFELPVDLLRQLNVRGTLDVEEAVFTGIRFTGVSLSVNARDGDVRLNPVQAGLYGGQYRGDIGIAAAGDTPRLTIDQQLANVDFAPLLLQLFETQRLSGRGSFTTQLRASGRDSEALKRTLDGTFDFAVQDGAVEGVDLWYEIRRARAVLRQQAVPARAGAERTAFTAMSGSGTADDGVFSTRDLSLAMQYLRVTGNAAVSLPDSTIDSRLEATVLRIPPEGADTADLQELVDARIPVRVTGPLTDPSVRPDVAGLIRNRVEQRIEEEKEKVEERVRETIQDRLRRALGGN